MQAQLFSNDFMRVNSPAQMPASGLTTQNQPYWGHDVPSSAPMTASQRFQPTSGYGKPGHNATQTNSMHHGQNSLYANRNRNPVSSTTSSTPRNPSAYGANIIHAQRPPATNHGHSYNANSRHTQQREFFSSAREYSSTGNGTSTEKSGVSMSTTSDTTTQHTNADIQKTNASRLLSPHNGSLQYLDHFERRLPDSRAGSNAIKESRHISGPTPPTRVGLPTQVGHTSVEAEIASLKAQVLELYREKEKHKANSELVNRACHELQEQARTLRSENDRLRTQVTHAVQDSARDRMAIEQVTAENQELYRRLRVHESNVTANETARRGSQNKPIDVDAEVVPAPATLTHSSTVVDPFQPQPQSQATSPPRSQPGYQSRSDSFEGQQESASSPPKPPRSRMKMPSWVSSNATDAQRQAIYPDGKSVGKTQEAEGSQFSETAKRKLLEDIEAEGGTTKPARKKQKKELTEWQKEREERHAKIQEQMFKESKRRAMEGAPPLPSTEAELRLAKRMPAVKENKPRPMGKKQVRAKERELARAKQQEEIEANRQESTRAVKETSVVDEDVDVLQRMLESHENDATGDQEMIDNGSPRERLLLAGVAQNAVDLPEESRRQRRKI